MLSSRAFTASSPTLFFFFPFVSRVKVLTQDLFDKFIVETLLDALHNLVSSLVLCERLRLCACMGGGDCYVHVS